MPIIAPQGRKLKSNNSVLHFANLSVRKTQGRRSLFGWIGILRLIGLITEIAFSFIPGAAPYAIALGSLFQQSLDTYQYITGQKGRSQNWTFALSTLVNLVPAALALRRGLVASKVVAKIFDARLKKGFRYVIKGIDKNYDEVFMALAKGENIAKFRASKINLSLQNDLIARKIIPSVYAQTVDDNFEKALQSAFSTQIINEGDKMLSGYRSTKYYVFPGKEVFSNRDLAIIRHEVRRFATGRTTLKAATKKFGSSLSRVAKEVIGFFPITLHGATNYGRRFILKTPARDYLHGIIKRLANIYLPSRVITPIKVSPLKRLFYFFGTRKGRGVTQAGQLMTANDMAREFLNKPMGLLLGGKLDLYFKEFSLFGKHWAKIGGLRGWARGFKSTIATKFPKIAKILKSPLTSRIQHKYLLIKRGLYDLKKRAILTKDDTFIMGWRITQVGPHFTNVIFYFNPINTNALTPGSKNYGGKKPFAKTMRNDHLKHLATTLHPGKVYLKGGGGFPPIALSPGGQRPVSYEIMSEALQLLSLYMPLNPLRNVLSLVSNTKIVVKEIMQGRYFQQWKTTFLNTLSRLWVNKVARLVGHTGGNIINQEVGMTLGRLLKTTGQGFQRTKTTIRKVKGRRVVSRYTTFSFKHKFKWQPLVKMGLPLTAKSTTLRRVSRRSNIRHHIKYQRYGRNVRRIPGLIF